MESWGRMTFWCGKQPLFPDWPPQKTASFRFVALVRFTIFHFLSVSHSLARDYLIQRWFPQHMRTYPSCFGRVALYLLNSCRSWFWHLSIYLKFPFFSFLSVFYLPNPLTFLRNIFPQCNTGSSSKRNKTRCPPLKPSKLQFFPLQGKL